MATNRMPRMTPRPARTALAVKRMVTHVKRGTGLQLGDRRRAAAAHVAHQVHRPLLGFQIGLTQSPSATDNPSRDR
ncbi:hypothetical protein G6F64_015539 [Rhizopus arrhizus]|uniref:Uncharacterized protein n=1 Tax=Rhizopus oryzae TaxID=64495 RepID=A0A9P6WRU7_RHIOR|nr:hypothetical protein G6F64_015539 [Rhizopus arrhizus]